MSRDPDKARAQAALFARFGLPQQVMPDESTMVGRDRIGTVRVYAVGSEEAAHAFVDAERRLWRNRARAELREGVGWVVVVDLRSVVEAAREREFEA